jgi:phytoene dehydrogenase-like protein
MDADAIIVGGGIAGLTAAAYLARSGKTVIVFEKQSRCGGLVSTFEREGFHYEGGIRAMENSGIVFPMLKQLGLDLEFTQNQISIGLEDQIVRIVSEENVDDYQDLLIHFYPERKDEIDAIFVQIRKIMGYMDVQYAIDNPAFLDFKEDRDYFIKVIFPWMFKYALTVRKITAMNEPVVDYLKRFTQDESLLDIITQHFFADTPAFFALSYLKLYLDYHYPMGGMGRLIEALESFIQENGGILRTETEIVSVDPERSVLKDFEGGTHSYRRLIWAADLNVLYGSIVADSITNSRVRRAFLDRKELLADKSGNDSIFTLYAGVDLPPDYFTSKASEHFFYTPSRVGESKAGPSPLDGDVAAIKGWLREFFALTTYEISIPVIRDRSMAPPGKTGLIISMLFDYQIAKRIDEMGWYEEFKSFSEEQILETLDGSIYPGIRDAVLHRFSSTPITIELRTGNTEGAITGWAFTNHPLPAESRLPKILKAIQTPLPRIFQAGQWTYSPSGLPVSILTGKLAADKVLKELKKLF